MQTKFDPEYLATDSGRRADEIIRSCVHCGFCNATCPTYQVLGDELDGPRGRIYLMREFLQSGDNAGRTTTHLDRCLTCRACETTCPSGVAYGELAEITRNALGVKRQGSAGLLRTLLQWMVPHAPRLRLMSRLGRPFKWLLPRALGKQIPGTIGTGVKTTLSDGAKTRRTVLLLNGCAQQVATAATNQHLQQLLTSHGVDVRVAADEGCCGALDMHLGDEAQALERIHHNVEVLHGELKEVDAILSTASGCGVMVKDYARLLANDERFSAMAQAILDKTMDVAEYLGTCGIAFGKRAEVDRVAFHSPCTLQHGQQIVGIVEPLLTGAGYELVPVADSHLCCGSAGTYSVLQSALSNALRTRKLKALQQHQPDVIASANVGCQTHLQGDATPVVHWIQLLN